MASINIIETDNSVTVASSPGITGALVVISKKGPANKATFITDYTQYKNVFGIPDPSKSVTPYAAKLFLTGSSSLYVSRAIHTAVEGSIENDENRTARFSACLVKGMINPIPSNVPDGSYVPERIINPLVSDDGYGLRQSDIDKFTFPLYPRQREYVKMKNKVLFDSTNSKILVVDNFKGFEIGQKLSFGDSVNDVSPFFIVNSMETVDVKFHKVQLDKAMTIAKDSTARRVTITKEKYTVPITTTGTSNENQSVLNVSGITGVEPGQTISVGVRPEKYVVQSVSGSTITLRTNITGGNIGASEDVWLWKREYHIYTEVPKCLRAVNGSNEVLVENIDFIGDGDIITFMPGLTNEETEATVTSKGIYTESQNQITLDQETSVAKGTSIQLMEKSETEQKDVLMIYSENQGDWGNDVTVSITESIDYPDTARFINVYYKGALKESYEVTFKPFVDGLNKQLYVEDRINGKSAYIRVIHNQDMVDDNGEPVLPLVTNYSLWRELPEDIFEDTGLTLAETVTEGETDIKVSDNTMLQNGDRLRFGEFGDEYKVTGKSQQSIGGGTEYHITIDRGIQVSTIANGAKVLRYKEQEFKPITRLGQIYTDYKKNDIMKIGNKVGNLIDPGCSLFEGGNDGSTPTIGDMIQALKVFESREVINVNLLMTGGVFAPAYATEANKLASSREDCFSFLSNDPSTLDANDPVTATIEFRQSLNINSSYSSLDADWIWIYDEDNQKEVLVSTDAMTATLQTLSSKSGVWGFVTAGWNRGKLQGVLRTHKTWNEAERNKLLENQINPLKVNPSRGISLWGNKTLLAQRSKAQQRNVRMILMQLNIALRDFLESVQWDFNDEQVRETTVSKIQRALNDDYMVVLEESKVIDTTTATDVNNNKMKIYVGLIPKGVSEDIDVTIGLFASGSVIEAV